MIQTFAPMLSNWRRAVTIGLGLGAAAGWGMLAVSGQSAAETERQLREQVADLQAGQTRLRLERDQFQSAATEVAQLRKQFSLARDEIARVAQDKTQVEPKLLTARPGQNAPSSAGRQSQKGASQTGSIASVPPPPPQAPARPVRTALTKP
jgi:septal ring factor EnvC (AmiA/AmiB activator)